MRMDLREELRSKLRGRLVVVGVGDSSHGDDGAGPMIAGLLAAGGSGHVIDAGGSPELETWRIREMRPDTVLFVDAVDFGGRPGDTALLEASQLRGSGFDTHRAPLRLTMDYLERELGCRCYLLGIQPEAVGLAASMGEKVRHSVNTLAALLSERAGWATGDRRMR